MRKRLARALLRMSQRLDPQGCLRDFKPSTFSDVITINNASDAGKQAGKDLAAHLAEQYMYSKGPH